MMTLSAMGLREQAAYLSPVWARYSDILVERGEGVYLYDVEDGATWISPAASA